MYNFEEEPKIINPLSTAKSAVHAECNSRIINAEILGDIFFGYGSYMNSGSLRSYVEIGRFCSIGRNVSIGLGNHDLTAFSTSSFFKFKVEKSSLKIVSLNPKRRVVVNHDVWIGDNVLINSGITIGTGAVIAAGSVVTKDVPPYAIVGGVPAKIIKQRFSENLINRILKTEWWEYDPKFLKSLEECSFDDFLDKIEEYVKKNNKHTYKKITLKGNK